MTKNVTFRDEIHKFHVTECYIVDLLILSLGIAQFVAGLIMMFPNYAKAPFGTAKIGDFGLMFICLGLFFVLTITLLTRRKKNKGV